MEQSPGQEQLHGLAQMLVLEGLLEEVRARDLLQEARTEEVDFVTHLVEAKVLPATTIASTVSKIFGVPLIKLSAFDPELMRVDLISEKFIRQHQCLPLHQKENTLFVAIADPSKQSLIDEIKFATGLTPICVAVDYDELSEAIATMLDGKPISGILSDFDGDNELGDLDISTDTEEDFEQELENSDDAPIVRFVHKILLDAINRGASDIHFEPYEKSYRVRMRMDGLLHEVANPPFNLANRIATRLKIMSQLDISERRVPQDGRFKMKISEKHAIDFRVSTCPTVTGEKIVMRLLDPASAQIGVEALGLNEKQKEQFLNVVHQPQGMVLVTGPTGSGKTVTLYTALNILNTIDKNISTAEDPVEIKLKGINQVNINKKTNFDFARALRAFLRQDPDIIMVGEIRDLETAEIAIKAAQTGHMVLSTLHTNSAPETLTRLVNMGVPSFNIATSVSMIIAQRLARRLCTKCRVEGNYEPDVLLKQGFSEEEINELTLYCAEGCSQCNKGFKGRVGIFEVLTVSAEIGDIIMRGGNSNDILNMAKEEGMLTLRDHALRQVKAGVTSLEEVNRVIKA